MITNYINAIREQFKGKSSFSKKELVKVLAKFYPDTNENTLKWKIYDLKEKGVIQHLARGLYSLTEQKGPYLPEISLEAKELYKNIQRELPYTQLSIADTRWFNEFMLHQVFRTYVIIEIEKDAAVTVFNRLSEQGKKAFLNPGSKVFELYIINTEEPIIIKPLISESPLIDLGDIKVASLEKLLVDCICDKEIYGAQYEEAHNIFKNTLEKYNVNISKLKRYARRRNRIVEINELIKRNKQYDR